LNGFPLRKVWERVLAYGVGEFKMSLPYGYIYFNLHRNEKHVSLKLK